MAVCSKTRTQESKASSLNSTNSVSKLLLPTYLHKDFTANVLQDHNEPPVSSDLLVTKTTSNNKVPCKALCIHLLFKYILLFSLYTGFSIPSLCTCRLRNHWNSELPCSKDPAKNTYLRKKKNKD